MGQVETSVRAMVASNGEPMSVIEPAKKEKKGAKYFNSGMLHATYCYIEENPTFSDVRFDIYLFYWYIFFSFFIFIFIVFNLQKIFIYYLLI